MLPEQCLVLEMEIEEECMRERMNDCGVILKYSDAPLQTEGVAVWRGRGTNRLVEQNLHQQSNHYKVALLCGHAVHHLTLPA